MNRNAALSALGALGAASVLPSHAFAAEAVRFATIPIDAGAEAFYALDRGYFRNAGIEAVVQAIPNGSAITAAVLGGSVDIGFSNMLSLAAAHEKNVPITLIAAAGRYATKAPTSVLMVAKDAPYKNARDLNEKTIAVNGLKNITQLAAQAWVDKNGGDSKSVKFVEVAFPDMPLALSAHRVDAALVAEPVVTEARGSARIIGKAYDAIAPNFLIGAWFASKAWAEAHPDLVRAIAKVMRETALWANRNGEASAAILAKSTKLDPATLQSMVRSQYGERLDVRAIQPLIDEAAKYGYLQASFKAEELIDKNALA